MLEGNVPSEISVTYLSGGGMQHANVLSSHNVDQFACFNMPDFYKVRLEGQDVWV